MLCIDSLILTIYISFDGEIKTWWFIAYFYYRQIRLEDIQLHVSAVENDACLYFLINAISYIFVPSASLTFPVITSLSWALEQTGVFYPLSRI